MALHLLGRRSEQIVDKDDRREEDEHVECTKKIVENGGTSEDEQVLPECEVGVLLPWLRRS